MYKKLVALFMLMGMLSQFSYASNSSVKIDIPDPAKQNQEKIVNNFPTLYEMNSKGSYWEHVKCNLATKQKDSCDFYFNKKNIPEVTSSAEISNLVKTKNVVHIWKNEYFNLSHRNLDDTLYFLDNHGNIFKHTYLSSTSLNEVLIQAENVGVKISRNEHWYNYPISFLLFISTLMTLCFPIILVLFLFQMVKKFFKSPAKAISAKEMPSFKDIAGNDYIKNELKTIADAFKSGPSHPSYNLVPSGILLTGPPGNGKTLLASALAHEINGKFLAINGADFVEMFAGLGPRRVAMTFNTARKQGDCVLFIDEIDAIGRDREKSGNDSASQEWVNTLNKLLDCMDGISSKAKPRKFKRLLSFIFGYHNNRVIIVAATNRPHVLDTALTRSGRLEKTVHIPAPDLKTRSSIARIHMRNEKVSEDFDFDMIGRSTAGMSGADIDYLCKESKVSFLRKRLEIEKINQENTALAQKEGTIANLLPIPDEIDMACFNDALDLKLLGHKNGAKIDKDTMELTAGHEGGHAFIAIHEFSPEFVRRITIEPRGNALGFVAMVPVKDRQSQSLSELRSMLRIQVAGRMAEELLLGADRVTTGAVGDIKQATNLARSMVMNFGLCPEVGMIEIENNNIQNPVSEETRTLVDRAVRKEIQNAQNDVRIILKRNQNGLHKLMESLLENNTQTGRDVAKFMLESDIGKKDVDDIVDSGLHDGSDALPGGTNSFTKGYMI